MSGDRPRDLGTTRVPGSTSAVTRRVSLAELPTQIPADGESLRPPVETELPPPALEVSEVLGIGGMGVVYKANQTDLARPVAFKRLLDAPTPQIRARFVREARLTAHLDHPNIVPVYLLDPGSTDTPSGYAMKLVEGKTLHTLIAEARAALERGEPLDDDHRLETRLEYFLKVCDAIAFAHDRRIIHRDLKPSNVMIGAFGAVYVMDWGIARMIGSDELEPDVDALTATRPSRDLSADVQLTQAGMFIGSPHYMSPEQAQGKNDQLDGRSDLYALGLVLHELVALRPAYTALTEEQLLEAVTNGRKPPLDALDGRAGQAPRELRAIVARATAYAPNARYASVRELADDVRRFLHGEAVLALPEGPLGRLLRFMSRHRRITAIAFVGVIVAAALAITWTRYRQAARELATRERGARMTALYSDVARQARRIDAELFRMEEALEGLSRAAEWSLVGPDPMPEDAPIFFDTDFADPRTRPTDFTKQTAYRWEVSLDHPVVSVAPGVDREAARPRVRRLTPLRTHIQQMVVAASIGDETTLAPDAARALLAARKSPIDYAYIDLPEGIHVVWPGMASLPPGYDVRTASFYQMSLNRRGKRWGAPYVDSTTDQAGDDLVLPVTQGLWSPTGQFLGVAGVEITVTKMVETTMVLPTRTVLRASLVDDQGRVVVDSRDAGKRFAASGKDEALAFAPYGLPEVVAAIKTTNEGLRETTRDGRAIAVAFVRLDALGWYYVVEVDASTLGAR